MLDLLTDQKALWYLNRASGLVLVVVFTLAILLGQYATRRRPNGRAPRFVWLELHRNLGLLGFVLLALHVISAVADDYVDITVTDVAVPFVSAYQPFWLGLGTLALDLLLALAVTTALRHRLAHRTWQRVHRSAYLMWPVSVVHGLGIGTDSFDRPALVLTIGCTVAVVVGSTIKALLTARDRVAELVQGPPTLPRIPIVTLPEHR